MDRLHPPPSSVTGPLGGWLNELWRTVNVQPRLSVNSFAASTPDSLVSGLPGDIVVNLAPNQSVRGWMMGGADPSTITTHGWQSFGGSTSIAALPSPTLTPTGFTFAKLPTESHAVNLNYEWGMLQRYGVVGTLAVDDTVAFRNALSDCAASNLVALGSNLAVQISGPVTVNGPGLRFDNMSYGNIGDPGIYATGSGYTAVTVTGQITDWQVTVYGNANAVSGVNFSNPILSRFAATRVYNLKGGVFGVQLNKTWDCRFGSISVELCQNLSDYAFSVLPNGDTTNMTHIERLQVERCGIGSGKAIWVDSTTLSCVIDNIHSEQITAVAGVDTWYLAGGVQYNSLRLAALGSPSNATAHFVSAVFIQPRVEGDITVHLEGASGGNLVLIRPDMTGSGNVGALTNQTGVITVVGGAIANLNSDGNVWRVFGTQITTLTVGFCNTDATRMQFYGCPITTLVSNSTTAAATFVECTISEGNSLLRGYTRLRGGTVTCAGTIAHSSGTLESTGTTITAALTYTNVAAIRLRSGARITGTVSCGDAGNVDFLCDDSSTVGASSTGVGVPTGGAHNVGDRHKNPMPAVGSPKAWVCTVAGTPGTFVSEGNL